MTGHVVLAILVGAAVGSIPTGWMVARFAGGVDPRTTGSGSTGATNVLRSSGRGPAAATLLLDLVKGAAAAITGGIVAPLDAGASAATCAAVAAHAYSPWMGGRGGKGVAPAAGAFAVIAPVPAAASVVLFGLVLALGRIVSAASLVAAVLFPVLATLHGEARSTILTGLAVGALIGWRHRGNVARLVRGREPRLGRGGSSR